MWTLLLFINNSTLFCGDGAKGIALGKDAYFKQGERVSL